MLRLAVFTALGLVAATGTATAQPPVSASLQGKTTRVGEAPHITAGGQTNWASHNLDPYNQRFAEIDQITAENASRLGQRWSFDAPGGISLGQATPLVVDGVMYLHGGQSVFAINAVTGESIWTSNSRRPPRVGARGDRPTATARYTSTAAGTSSPWTPRPGNWSQLLATAASFP